MSSAAVHFLVLVVYLAVLLGIGLVARRRAKSAQGFYLGERSIGAWVTAFSYLAAYYSSVVIIGGGGFGYKYGMATLWVGATNVVVGTLLAWIVLGARTRAMTGRLNSITMPEFFARRFASPEARFVSALVVTVFLVIYSVSVIQGMGHAFEVLVDIRYAYGVLLSALVIVAYVSLGGYVAVVWTGFVQGVIMIFGLVLLTVLALGKVGGLTQLFSRLAAVDSGRFVATPGVWGWPGMISFSMIVSFGVWGMPQLITRFYSVRNTRVIKLGTVLATAGGAVALLPYFNGALTRVLFPGLAAADTAIPTLAKAAMPAWASAVFLAAVVAAGMSTFSAVLIVAVSSLVKDLARDGFGARLDPKKEVLVSRLVSVAVGLAAVAIALKPPAMILVITGFAWAVIASTTLWPYVLGLYWTRATRAGTIAAMVGGCVVSLAWMALRSPFGIHGFLPGVATSLALFVLVGLATKPPSAQIIAAAFGPRPRPPGT